MTRAAIVDALRERFPTLATPRKEDICYATQNRQDAVKELLEQVRRAARGGLAHQLEFQSPARARRIAPACPAISSTARMTCSASGSRASARSASPPAHRRPRVLVQQVVARLREWGGAAPVDVLGREENVVFSLPRELRDKVPSP